MAKLLAKATISALLIWLLLRATDTSQVASQLTRVEWQVLLLGILALGLLSLVQAVRWVMVIRAIGHVLNFRAAWQIVLIGLFFNQTLPSTIGGDAVRMWRAHQAGLRVGAAINTVVVDRLVALTALLLVIIAGQPVFFALIGDPAARWAMPAVIACGVLGLVILLAFDRLPARLFRWRLARAAATLAADARRVFLSARDAAVIFIPAVLIHVTVPLIVFLIAASLDIEVSLLQCLVLVPPVLLISALPISVAGWGVREGAMVAAFGFVDVPASDALALSVLLGLMVMSTGLPGGLIWLFTGGKKAKVLRLKEATPEPPGAPMS